ncbi:MAG: AAA family ATPase [Clostridia bacterium]|nr:AAA family ATPase [Clostridia bacterium]
MNRYGLLGEHLGHSFSVPIHNLLADYEYKLYEKTPAELEDFLKNPQLDGMNVTIPYKKTVIPFCNSLSDTAQKIGSVNTLVLRETGWHGDNTDYYGFEYMLKSAGISPKNKKVIILGSGGASLTARCVAQDLGASEIVVISRSGENNYDNISRHFDADIIVNATPVGMYPQDFVSPINLGDFKNCSGVADMIYNPARTKLLYDAEVLGIPHTNGLTMLVAQAKRACEIFTGKSIEDGRIDEIVKIIQSSLKNIVLIGMPGCGKSLVGKLLAQKLGRPFADCDAMITEREGNIENIFAQKGEEFFRSVETSVIDEISKESGYIISTGGGCVTRAENYPLLHRNSTIIWLKRDITTLATNGRPLSNAGNLAQMYQIRKPLYQKFCDFEIDNNCPADETVKKILELI